MSLDTGKYMYTSINQLIHNPCQSVSGIRIVHCNRHEDDLTIEITNKLINSFAICDSIRYCPSACLCIIISLSPPRTMIMIRKIDQFLR